MKLTTDFYLVTSIRMSRAKHLLAHVFTARTDNFTRWSRKRIFGTHRSGRLFETKFPTGNRNIINNVVAHHSIGSSISSSVKNNEEISKDGRTRHERRYKHKTLEGWTNARIPRCEDTLYVIQRRTDSSKVNSILV